MAHPLLLLLLLWEQQPMLMVDIGGCFHCLRLQQAPAGAAAAALVAAEGAAHYQEPWAAGWGGRRASTAL